MPQDMTWYDVVVTELAPQIVTPACLVSGSYFLGDFYSAVCHAEEHVDLYRVTVIYVYSPGPDDTCIVKGYHVTEIYHSLAPCDEEFMNWLNGEDGTAAKATMWSSLIRQANTQPARQNHTDDKVVPETSLEDVTSATDCQNKNGAEHTYRLECINNRLEVVRRSRITIATPTALPNQPWRCHVIRFDRTDRLSTGKDCDEFGLIFQEDAEKEWAVAAKARWGEQGGGAPLPESGTQRLSPGMERTAPEPYRSGAAELRQESGYAIEEGTPGRLLYLERLDGEPIVGPGDFKPDDPAVVVEVYPDGGKFKVQFNRKPISVELDPTAMPEAALHLLEGLV